MISVKLFGGIGNQIFQFAFGLSQAKKLNTELKLNTGILENTPSGWTKYVYELGCFEGINEQIYNNEVGLRLVGENEINNITDNCLLDGYWQDAKLFDNIKEELRNKLEFRPTIKFGNIDNYSHIIEKNQSVFIHIRRGDYLNGDYFIDLSKTNYYQNAIEYIKTKIQNPTFYIFSNDIEWTKEYFKDLQNDKYFLCNATNEDLYLMSLCKHSITANSTFSYWGSWLNKNKDKIVIQPEKWTRVKNIDSLKLEGSILL